LLREPVADLNSGESSVVAELLGLMLDMRESPWLVLIWFGPVLWIGIALFEELTHWSQGPYGIVTIAIKSLVAGSRTG
jgi:hypothetical protein